MDDLTLAEVARRSRFRCALCARILVVQQLEAHAGHHARRGECLSYPAFARQCAREPALDGLPVKLANGREVVWPFATAVATPRAVGERTPVTGAHLALV